MKDLPRAETPKDLKKMSNDQKGKWVLVKFIVAAVAAKSLDILNFLESQVGGHGIRHL
jgi:hypothetical protein